MQYFIRIQKNIGLALAAFIISTCATGRKEPTPEKTKMMVFAAAGLREPINEMIDSFEAIYPVEVQANYASSGTLARQIEQQVLPDVYLSASVKWMHYIDSLGYIVHGRIDKIVKDKLVLVAPQSSSLNNLKADSSQQLINYLAGGKLSMGDPAHVPAGAYAKQVLDYYGWAQAAESLILPAKDVRSALMMVEMEEAPLGIVYYSVAKKSDKVKILTVFAEASHQAIVFTAGACRESVAVRNFIAYLQSETAVSIWMKYGFEAIPSLQK